MTDLRKFIIKKLKEREINFDVDGADYIDDIGSAVLDVIEDIVLEYDKECVNCMR